MNRRSIFQAAALSAVATQAGLRSPRDASAQPLGRELVVHTVHEALVHSSPLATYAALQATPPSDQILNEAAGGEFSVDVWDDWNDESLHRVFGAFVVASPQQQLGSYRIFDTPDIAWSVHQPVIDEIERGHIPVGGVRASLMDAGGLAFASLRLWNVIIEGVGENEEQMSDVMLGLVKHLGRSLGAVDA